MPGRRDADHELSALALLRLDDRRQGGTKLNKREASRYDADQRTAGSAHRFSNDEARVVGRFSRNAHLENRAGGRESTLDDAGGSKFRP